MCPRCLELEDEVENLRQRLAAVGQYVIASPGPNSVPDCEHELRRWLAVHSRADAATPLRDANVRVKSKRRSILGWIAPHRWGFYRRGVSKLAVMVSGRARPGKRDEVRRLFEAHLAPHAIANASQPIVVWSADNGDPDAFYL
jgi:hypothetical protein